MVRLIARIINWLVNTLWFAARLTTPWIIRVVVATAWIILTTLASFWIGIPVAIERIAIEWRDRAIYAGFPSRWDIRLYNILWWMALLTIVTGWIVLSFTTVFIWRLFF